MRRRLSRPTRVLVPILTATALIISTLLPARARADDTGAPSIGSYTPGKGFLVGRGDKGELNLRLYGYVRYLNQQGLDESYTNAFGTTTAIDRRQDVMLNKVTLNFMGWFMDPRFRYLLYAWTNNTAQGQGAQVVIGGWLNYRFNPHLTVGGGVNSLPGVRSTEGNFPLWLPLDNRMLADEFFRPSYTMGFWAQGKIVEGLDYQAMIGNNLSQLGVDAGQLDDQFNTISTSIAWYPTTKEFGYRAQFGDFDDHEKVATRLSGHFTRSPETRQGQPDTDAFENVQIRLSDGSIIFAPDLFGEGIQIDEATYHMTSVDGGVKYRGFALEGEYYWRWVNGFTGTGTENLGFDELNDNGFQLMASAMVVPKTVQPFVTWSKVFGEYGDPWEVRGGLNLFPWKNQVVRCNIEWIHSDRSPVGGLSLPYQVGGNGDAVHFDFMIDF